MPGVCTQPEISLVIRSTMSQLLTGMYKQLTLYMPVAVVLVVGKSLPEET